MGGLEKKCRGGQKFRGRGREGPGRAGYWGRGGAAIAHLLSRPSVLIPRSDGCACSQQLGGGGGRAKAGRDVQRCLPKLVGRVDEGAEAWRGGNGGVRGGAPAGSGGARKGVWGFEKGVFSSARARERSGAWREHGVQRPVRTVRK